MSGLDSIQRTVAKEIMNNNGKRASEKLEWIINRAKQYAEHLKMPWESILDEWENQRNYNFMNYYQDANFPDLAKDNIIISQSIDVFYEEYNADGFRCPYCNEISSNPFECDTGKSVTRINDKRGQRNKCNWKSYGLFGPLSKGSYVLFRDQVVILSIFTPCKLEEKQNANN